MTYLGIIGILELILIIVALSGITLTIVALIDILKSEFEGNNKIVWVVVVLLINIIGAILYFNIGRKQKITG